MIVQWVLATQSDQQRPVSSRSFFRVVPLQIVLSSQQMNITSTRGGKSAHRPPIMQIYRLPKRVVTGIERPALPLKFVREDEDHVLVGVQIRALRVRLDGCVLVDEPPVSDEGGDLAGRVCPTQVEPALRALLLLRQLRY